MKKLLLFALSFGALVAASTASAQYYTWGSDPPMKWSTMRTPDVRVIYPDTASAVAQRTLFYIRTVRPDIGYGFRHGPMRIPFVLHPENFQSNGLVMFLPKRVEFLTSPRIDGYSMPWYKQLVAHEYRHAVQYNNLDRGVVRVLSYVLGQQGSTIGLLFMPIWALEGDATMSETMMSSFGRGLQPSFSMGYRAIGEVGADRRNIDRWFCGSYRDYIPDHYELGYQICSYAYDHFGENIWDKVVRYSVRNPYVIATTRVGMSKYYKTYVGQLFRNTFGDLARYWDSLPKTEDSAKTLTPLASDNYTTYEWPLFVNDTTALALRKDYDRPARFVRIDTRTGSEQLVAYTGSVSSRPSLDNQGRVWWTEYRRSTLFEQRVNSQLCYLDLADGRPHAVSKARRVLYPTSAGDDFAWVDYNPDGRYTVVVKRAGGAEERFEAPADKEIHGLAWDDVTAACYVLITDDGGMWIGRIGSSGLEQITAPAYITLSNLRAGGGKLWFGSIASGRDEVHGYDLAQGREYRLTTSAYGSFSPDADDRRVLLTSYDRKGYRVTMQEVVDSALVAVEPSKLPINLVNPPRKRWDVVNLDTVRFDAAEATAQKQEFRSKRYRKVPNLVNIHSWMPVAFNPFDAVDEQNININLGATLLSQNLLSNTEAFASYGWNSSEGSLVKMGVRYFGLGVRFDFDFDYGGNQLFYPLLSGRDPDTGAAVYQKRPAPEKYYSVGLSATLPLYFQRGYHTRQFLVTSGWNYSNGMVANLGKIDWKDLSISNIEHIGFSEGLHKLTFGLTYADQVRLAHRDFAPRWGYQMSANYTLNPANSDFSDLISLYAQSYLPGVVLHHSIKLAATYQTSIGGYKFPSGQAPLNYRSTRLIPRGFKSADIASNNYMAFSADYQLPVWYPEGGLGSLLYFKRIRLGVGGDYAQFQIPGRSGEAWQRIWSVGGDLIFDVNLFRQPSSATSTFKLSVYRPSLGSVFVSAGVGLPF